MDSVEVVVRFAGTLLQVAQLAHGKSFRIGTAAGVDLPLDIAPLTSFPLIDSTADGFVVRCPAGVPCVEYTEDLAITVTESELKLARGSRIDFAFGRVMISIARVGTVKAPLPRTRPSYVPHLFAAGSLAAHVVMLLVAVIFADLDEIAIPVITEPDVKPTYIARHPSEAQKARARMFAPKKEKPKRAPVAAAIVVEDPDLKSPDPKVRAIAGARAQAGFLDGIKPEQIRALTGTKNLAKALDDVGPIWDEDAYFASQFGGASGRFDISGPEFDSVKTGRYATKPTGSDAGEFFDIGTKRTPVVVAMCESDACVVVGGVDRAVVHDGLVARVRDIRDCYDRHAPETPAATVTLTFAIAKTGKVEHVRAVGPGAVGTCVADIAKRIEFPSGEAFTQVTYPLAFTRS
jgi:hypothetical protein